MPQVNQAKKEILKPFYLIGVIIVFTLVVYIAVPVALSHYVSAREWYRE